MENVSSRVGYRIGDRVRSIRMNRVFGGPDSVEAIGGSEQEVMDWFRQQPYTDEDKGMIGYFYRCMEEGSEFYYIYDVVKGWECGGVTGDTPLRGRLVELKEAREVMEEWIEDLKYQEHDKRK